MDKRYSKFLPNGFVAFENQVAGHNSKDEWNPTGILKSSEDFILKPLIKRPQSECEVNFYETLAPSEKLAPVRRFIPEYKGTVIMEINNKNVAFLKIRDATSGLVKPCVMDIKMGAQTWEPGASEMKRLQESSKYVESRQFFGFSIPGYQVHDVCTQTFSKMGKELGKFLNKETLPQAILEFLNYKSGHSDYLIDQFLELFRDLLTWWTSQTEVQIFSSSLLLCYDAHQIELMRSKSNKKPDPSNAWIKLRMIDFAHVVSAKNHLDHNYISALTNLIALFERLKMELTL